MLARIRSRDLDRKDHSPRQLDILAPRPLPVTGNLKYHVRLDKRCLTNQGSQGIHPYPPCPQVLMPIQMRSRFHL